MSFPRRASIRSVTVSRSIRKAFWSICPSRITVLGRPDIRLKNHWLRKLSTDPSSSSAAIRKSGMRLAVTGTSSDSMEMEARLEMRMVETSSSGCSSPSWRLPISRMENSTQR